MRSSLLSPGMLALLSAQFLSALADNALFIVAIASIKASGHASMDAWLQGSFVVAYILLAPFVGPFADALPKGRVMMISNLLKFGGASLMLFGANPLVGYLIAGVGAAAYSPAKYGILTQMHDPSLLVRANGMIEGSTIAAVLMGAVLGGWLSDISIPLAFSSVIGIYLLAAAANLLIPRFAPEHPHALSNPKALAAEFSASLRSLWAIPDARFSLIGTSSFWGIGASLRLLVFLWAPVALGVSSNGGVSLLMGAVSIGVVLGAGLAAWAVPISIPNRSLWGAFLLGPCLLALPFISDPYLAAAVLAALGACGGFFVVPLNALLQENAHETVGAGHGLAIQNLFENILILIFIGLYHLASTSGLPPSGVAFVFGLLALFAMGSIGFWRLRSRPSPSR